MNAPRCSEYDYIDFLVATPRTCSCTEAARVQPDSPRAPAHDSFTRLLHRLEPDPVALWGEARSMVRKEGGLLVLDDSTLDKHYARKIKRAQILLAADSGLGDDDIAAAVAVGGSTVYRTKRRFVKGNLEAALNEEPRAGADRKLTSNEEALLIATACSSPPEGRARWTLELLAGRWSS